MREHQERGVRTVSPAILVVLADVEVVLHGHDGDFAPERLLGERLADAPLGADGRQHEHDVAEVAEVGEGAGRDDGVATPRVLHDHQDPSIFYASFVQCAPFRVCPALD